METIKRIIPYIKPYKLRMFAAFLAMMFVSGITGINVWLVMPLIDKAFIGKDINTLHFIIAMLISIYFLKAIFNEVSYEIKFVNSLMVISSYET